MRQPLVSIILCVYKVEKFIGHCCETVFGQTYPNIEFIFVDDGSPDDSIAVVEELLNGRFIHLKGRVKIIRQENMGLAGARVSGLAVATGEYVLFIDPDDWCSTSQVEKMVAAAVEQDADMVICNYYSAYRHHKVPRREKRYESKHEMIRALVCHHHLRGYLWDKLVRRELYTNPDLFFPRTCHCEDLVRTAQAIHFAKHVVYIRDRLAYYNKTNPNSASKRQRIIRTTDVIHNIMGLFMHYYGKPDSPFEGFELPMLLSIAVQVLRIQSFDLFRQYPVILEKCAAVIESYPRRDLFKDIPRSTQKETKRLYNLYRAELPAV